MTVELATHWLIVMPRPIMVQRCSGAANLTVVHMLVQQKAAMGYIKQIINSTQSQTTVPPISAGEIGVSRQRISSLDIGPSDVDISELSDFLGPMRRLSRRGSLRRMSQSRGRHPYDSIGGMARSLARVGFASLCVCVC